MSCYWFNRSELLQKAKNKCYNYGGKEKAVRYYLENKEVLKEKTNNKYRNLSEEEKEAKREYERNRYRNIKEKQAKEIKCYLFVQDRND